MTRLEHHLDIAQFIVWPSDRQLSGTLENTFDNDGIKQTLRSIRRHLKMDVAFISRFLGSERVFREVDCDLSMPPMRAGESTALEDSYCQRISDGRLPHLMPDAAAVPAALELPVTLGLPVRSHLSVPIVFSNGQIYGTFCCFSFAPHHSLNERDLDTLRAIADMTAHYLEKEEAARSADLEKRTRIQAVLDMGGPTIVYQPIVLLADLRVIGVEALSRFQVEPRRAPDAWFKEAGEIGLRIDLERAAIRNAIDGWRHVWQQSRLQLNVNCSAETLIRGHLEEVFETAQSDRIILELTEHDQIDDYYELTQALAPLRARASKVAIDDAGSGYASMRHILNTKPDIIKLDISLTKNIDTDGMRRALATALVRFAEGFEGSVIAEGVETESELETLRLLGVQAAQGYHIAHPMSAEAFHKFLSRR